jgi:DNA replication and repair protein RecF
MQILKIHLSNFRNFTKKSFEFSKDTTVIVGPNASGKTNILESIFLLSTGKSFRARLEEEMIRYSGEISRIKGQTYTDSQKTVLEIVLTRGQIDIGTERPEKVPRKKLLVNGIGRHLYTFAGNLKIVLFGPWDLDLVTESPSVRRRFLDNVLSQVDSEYRRASLSYEKGLRQRNRLLFRIREEGLSRGMLLFWDQLLIKSGDYISRKRESFIDFVNQTKDFNGQDFNLEYDKSAISEGRLDQYKEEEIAAATTLVGPHRDDFQFSIVNEQLSNKSKRDLARYGSRGEQRMGVLWLKLAELNFIKEVTGEKPVLLLDDIFSELDHEHRDIVMEVCKNQQTIITTADEHFVEDFKSSNIIKL